MIYMRNITITTAKSATYLENVGLCALRHGPQFLVPYTVSCRCEYTATEGRAEVRVSGLFLLGADDGVCFLCAFLSVLLFAQSFVMALGSRPFFFFFF